MKQHATAARSLRVYFDYISPFAYVASEVLPAFCSRHGLVPDWRPIELLALSSFEGGMPYSASKRRYVAIDAARTAERFGVALRPPNPFPVASGRALELAVVAQSRGGFDALHRLLFRAAWRDQQDLASGEVLSRCLVEADGDPAWLAAAGGDDVGATLAANRAEAESLGVFGVPTLVLGDEIFWGVDALPALAWCLERDAASP
jgi:2-hydroxychromene-2-carboxylate isomerase